MFGAKKAVPSATAVMGAAADGRASIPTITHAAQPVAAAPASLTAVTARKPGRTRTLSKDDLSKLAAEQRHRRQRDFGRIVALLASVPEYQDLPLKDLHWLVMPAVTAGQYLMAEVKSEAGKPSGLAAVLLWARLSPEVEARVAEAKAKPIHTYALSSGAMLSH